MKTILTLSLLALMPFLFTGCETTKGAAAAASYNEAPYTVAIPTGLSNGEIQDSMVRALAGRDWTVTDASSDHVSGELNHRSYKAKVTLQRKGNNIEILSNSTILDAKSGEYVPAVPTGWLANLQKDLRKNFSAASYDSI